MIFSLARLRKEQNHSPNNRVWSVKGDSDFTAFSYTAILSGDVWRCTSDEQIVNNEVGNPVVYKGDLIIAMIDNPDELNYTNLNNGNWDILRRNPIGHGTKKSGRDGGRLFEQSIDDDYYYICVLAGDPETLEGADDGTAIWKKSSLTTT